MAPEPPRRAPAPKRTLDQEFEGFGDRAESFARSLLTLAGFQGDLTNYAAEPNLRIVRKAFGKWSCEALLLLASERRATFGRLRKGLPGVSARVLSRKLTNLEASGLVSRTVLPTRPPRPEYALTERAAALVRQTGRVLAFVRSTAPVRRAPAPPAPAPATGAEPAPSVPAEPVPVPGEPDLAAPGPA